MTLDGVRAAGARSLRLLSSGPLQIAQRLSPSALNGVGSRLSPLDVSFLQLESPAAHMHLGWAALLTAPEGARRPSFTELRDHIDGRLARAARYRQKLAGVPLGINDPVWVDDQDFDIERHVRRSTSPELGDVVNAVMSQSLRRDRPLWELWIADRLDDGHIGVVGKVHHCMVDGLAAAELMALLLDPSPDPPPSPAEDRLPTRAPSALSLFAAGTGDRVREGLGLACLPLRLARSPKRVRGLPAQAARAARAVAHAAAPAASPTLLNGPLSPQRHLVGVRRPLEELKLIKRHFGITVNDVLLAVCAGGMRRFVKGRGETPQALKTMVPVSVRRAGDGARLGNRIAFVFVALPCQEPDAVRRLTHIHVAMSECKRAQESQGADDVLDALRYAPRTVRRAASRLAASPRAFNLTVSNIPGPGVPLYMLGCRLAEAYPVVPLAERHAVSIGMTTIEEQACFGVYADRESLPDAHLLADGIEASIAELLELSTRTDERRRPVGVR